MSTYCIYHVKLYKLRLALNLMRTNNIVHENQLCDYICDVCNHGGHPCQASCTTYKELTKLWDAIICWKNEFDEWHKQKCLFGECSKCGIQIHYHYVQRKWLVHMWCWYHGGALFLKPQWQGLTRHWRIWPWNTNVHFRWIHWLLETKIIALCETQFWNMQWEDK